MVSVSPLLLAGCGLGEPTLSLLGVVSVSPLLLAGCGLGEPTFACWVWSR